jgi:hypothetical protein
MARIPSINETIEALRSHFNRGGAMGGTITSNAYGSESNMRPARTAGGGATAGLGANPSRTGWPSAKGMGGQSLVPNGAPHVHALTRASLTHLASIGHPHPRHSSIMAATQGHLDRHAAAKLNQAKRASVPKPAPSMGTLGGSAGGGPDQTGLLSSGGQTGVPSADASMTAMSPLQQRTSGGSSQVPNASSGSGRRGGPGYDW